MKKLLLISTILLFSLPAFASGQTRGQAKKEVIAVLDFRSIAAPAEHGIGVAEILRTELSTLGGYIVAERGALNKVIEEQKLQLTGLVDSQTAAALGALVGANYVVVGSIVKFGDTFTINARLVDVKTGQVRIAQNVRGKSESELSSMVYQLALILTGKTTATVEIPRSDPPVRREPPAVAPKPGTPSPLPSRAPPPPAREPVARVPVQKLPEIREMIHIPAGPFLMGSDEGPESEKPVHEVSLKGFLMDQYEVSNDLYSKFRIATGHLPPAHWTDEKYNKPDLPVVGVSWHDAAAYCQWAGKRLPTEAEWEKGARGSGGLRARHPYPWGNEGPNVGGSYRANYDPGNFKEDGYEGLAPVNSFEAGAAVWPQGKIYNLIGNAREWTASHFEPYPNSSFKSSRMGRNYNAVRGGSWKDSASYLRISYRDGWPPGSKHPHIGFRCARDE